MNFYRANICKHEHEKKMTKIWCKIVLKILGNEGSYFYLYPFGDLVQRNFQGVSMCASSNFFKKKPSYLRVYYELIII
jgi:hypothetical protein